MSNSINGHVHGRGAVARQIFATQQPSRRVVMAIRHLSARVRRIATVTGVLVAMALGTVQSADAAYVTRYATTTRGGVTFTGNTLGLSRANSAGGLTAPGTNDSIGAFSTINTALQVGTYPAGTTGNWMLNSAAATLVLPAGSNVLHAELIWGGTMSAGGEDVSGSINTPISFTVPGNPTPFTITPDAATSQLGGNFYIRSANVTSLVQVAGAGSYVTGGVPGTRGNDNTGNTAGWTLAVVFGDNTLPVRNMTVFVGAEIGGDPAAQVSGFCTPPTGALNGRVLVTALEGDANRNGDTFLFGPTSTLGTSNRLSGTNNPVGNFFASQLNQDNGVLSTTGTFGSRNHNAAAGTNVSGGRQGWDITNVDGSAQLGHSQTSAFAQGTTTGDQYTISGLGLQIDVFAPSFPVVVKAVDHASTFVGDVLTYTVTLQNTGGAIANNVIFNDPAPANTSFVPGSFIIDGAPQPAVVAPVGVNLGSIAIGAQKVITFQVQVNSQPASLEIRNAAQWDYTYAACSSPIPGTVSTNEVVTPFAVADLAISKTDGSATYTPGAPISYTVTVNNAGPDAASGFDINDSVPVAITGVSASCAVTGTGSCGVNASSGNAVSFTGASLNAGPGNSLSITISGTVAPGASGNLINTATVTAGDFVETDNGNNSATDTDTAAPVANLSITKTDGSATYVPGGPISYTIVASNAGPSDVIGATVSDTLPAAITGATWACVATGVGATCPASGVGNINAIVNLPAGGSALFTVTASVSASATGNLVNSAAIVPPSGTTDPDPGDNSATDTDTPAPVADIVVVKTGTTSVGYGGALSYTVVVSNNGLSNANGTTFSDAVPAGVSAITASCGTPIGGAVCGTVNVTGNTVTSTITTLPAGASVTFTINGTAPSSGTSISNTASAMPPVGTTDPDPGNNSDTATTTLLQPQLSVSKTASPNPFVVGQAASYTITVVNNGTGPSAGNITISDNLPTGITLASTGGANWSCIGTSALTCTFSGTLAAGTSTVLTLNVNVGASATTADNTATASGGGDPACPAAAACSGTVVVPVQPSADVSIVKSAPATITSGATISYTLLIANAGPSAANGATYSDAVPAAITGVAASCGTPAGGAVCAVPAVAGNTVSGSVPTLPSGGSVTITITGTAPFGAQTLANSASVSVPPGTTDPDPGNNDDSTTTTVGNAADIAVTKTVDNAAPNVGDTVTFTISATNNGPDDATGVALTDSLPFGFGFVSAAPSQGSYDDATGLWTIGNLANGASVTMLMSVTIDEPGALVNTIAVSASDQPDPDTSNNNAGAAVNAGASADIAVSKGVDNAVPNVGDSVTYTINATNNGPNDATGIEITDSLPAGVTFVSATPSQGTYNPGSGVWTVGALLNGASASLALTVSVEQAGAIMNTATVTAEDQFDPVSQNNESGVSINGQEADLAVTKTVDNAKPDVGDVVAFTISVHNNGPSDATGVELTDALPAGLAFDSATPSQGSYDDATGVWTVGTLTASGPTSTATLTLAATVTAAGAMTNTATVTGADQPDPNSQNNSDNASLNGNPLADLALVKSGPATVTPGDMIVYTVVVTNNGPSDAVNVTVTDPTPAGLTFVDNTGACTTAYPCSIATLANGASATISTTYSVPANYSGASPIVNTASASSDTPDPDNTNNQGTVQTGVGPGNADLSIVKTGPVSVLSGGAISYTLTISNNGPSPANGAIYSDDVPLGISGITASCAGETGGAACTVQPTVSGNLVSGTIGTLPSGGGVIVTINGTAPAGPATLDNTATIAPPAGVNDPDPSDNSSSIGTGVGVPMADLAVEKTGPLQVVAGATVTYTLSVTNNGPDSALAVSLDDPAPAGLSFISASTPCQAGFPCVLGDLPNGASTIVTVTFAVDAALAGTIVNSANASSPTTDPDPSDNEDTVTTPVVPAPTSANLSVSKSGPADVLMGSNVVYTIVVSNAGPDAAANVIVSDPTPPGLSFVGNAGACATAYPCLLGTLASGASATITSTYAVPSSYAGPNPIVNRATVGSDTPDPDGGDNGGETTTPVITPLASADLAVVKSGPDSATPGSSIGYTLVVTNHGPDAVTDAVLEDPTPAGLSFVSASAPCGGGFPCVLGALANGASTIITVTYQVQPGYTGAIANHASAGSPSVPDPDPANDTDTATTVVVTGTGVDVTPVPVDARWMLMLMALLLAFAGAPLARRRR
jgi:uncharacterized repeat protein (TIGR01451 family)